MVFIKAMHKETETHQRKVAGGVRSVGNKVSTVLLRAAPAVAAFGAPELSAGMLAVA